MFDMVYPVVGNLTHLEKCFPKNLEFYITHDKKWKKDPFGYYLQTTYEEEGRYRSSYLRNSGGFKMEIAGDASSVKELTLSAIREIDLKINEWKKMGKALTNGRIELFEPLESSLNYTGPGTTDDIWKQMKFKLSTAFNSVLNATIHYSDNVRVNPSLILTSFKKDCAGNPLVDELVTLPLQSDFGISIAPEKMQAELSEVLNDEKIKAFILGRIHFFQKELMDRKHLLETCDQNQNNN